MGKKMQGWGEKIQGGQKKKGKKRKEGRKGKKSKKNHSNSNKNIKFFLQNNNSAVKISRTGQIVNFTLNTTNTMKKL